MNIAEDRQGVSGTSITFKPAKKISNENRRQLAHRDQAFARMTGGNPDDYAPEEDRDRSDNK
jgi:hypothetical protein